jgi:uncharacterized membrane protein
MSVEDAFKLVISGGIVVPERLATGEDGGELRGTWKAGGR